MIYGDLGNGISIEKVDDSKKVPKDTREKLYTEYDTR